MKIRNKYYHSYLKITPLTWYLIPFTCEEENDYETHTSIEYSIFFLVFELNITISTSKE